MERVKQISSQKDSGKVDVPVTSQNPGHWRYFLFNTYWPPFVAILVSFIVWFIMFKTPFGLSLRSVGEHPMAADTMGINVTKMRYIGVIISGAFAGVGGGVYAPVHFI